MSKNNSKSVAKNKKYVFVRKILNLKYTWTIILNVFVYIQIFDKLIKVINYLKIFVLINISKLGML